MSPGPHETQAPNRRQQRDDLAVIATVAQGNEHIAVDEHTQIAMASLRGVEKERRAAS